MKWDRKIVCDKEKFEEKKKKGVFNLQNFNYE